MNQPFVGLGNNPESGEPDIPIGLGLAIFENKQALDTFGRLSADQKRSVIGYVQGGVSGDEAKLRIRNAVNQLAQNDLQFF